MNRGLKVARGVSVALLLYTFGGVALLVVPASRVTECDPNA